MNGDSGAKNDNGYMGNRNESSGVGRGRMYLYAGADGNVKAVSNGFAKSKIHDT
ncbi:hypothetical protein [Paracidovorax oryzae]|uniref:hypothetical protein n=1 Tax=Paracidovorax oryzae TaxID=862720 RepID=UPI00030CDA90|nr:hypothetical protein [Paracidovorax oryzae]